jgi:hypothetical protein
MRYLYIRRACKHRSVTVSEWTDPDFKRYISGPHLKDVEEWLKPLLFSSGALYVDDYGYESRYADDLDRYLEVRKSDDFSERYKPDVKTTFSDVPFLIDHKAKLGYLPAVALMMNARRNIRTFYTIGRAFAAFADDLVENQRIFFESLQFTIDKKPLPPNVERDIRDTFNMIDVQFVARRIGWREPRWKGYISGDPCVKFRADAPLSDLYSFFKQLGAPLYA